MGGTTSPAGGLREEMTSIEEGQRTIPLFVASPAGDGPFPGLVLVHEIFGLNEHIKDVARRFAREGLCVYAPDLFASFAAASVDRDSVEAMREVWASIPDRQLIQDLQQVLHLAVSSGDVRNQKVGALGYCMGGAIAFMFACSSPEISWVADYYGRIFYPELSDNKPKHPIDYAGGLNGSFLGVFAGLDQLITDEHVEQLRARLEQLGKSFEIKVYSHAQHAFFNDTRPNYHAEAAEDAWKVTMEFIWRQVAPAAGLGAAGAPSA